MFSPQIAFRAVRYHGPDFSPIALCGHLWPIVRAFRGDHSGRFSPRNRFAVSLCFLECFLKCCLIVCVAGFCMYVSPREKAISAARRISPICHSFATISALGLFPFFQGIFFFLKFSEKVWRT
jgi:hypothetical protein